MLRHLSTWLGVLALAALLVTSMGCGSDKGQAASNPAGPAAKPGPRAAAKADPVLQAEARSAGLNEAEGDEMAGAFMQPAAQAIGEAEGEAQPQAQAADEDVFGDTPEKQLVREDGPKPAEEPASQQGPGAAKDGGAAMTAAGEAAAEDEQEDAASQETSFAAGETAVPEELGPSPRMPATVTAAIEDLLPNAILNSVERATRNGIEIFEVSMSRGDETMGATVAADGKVLDVHLGILQKGLP